jgi:hypothetical protein
MSIGVEFQSLVDLGDEIPHVCCMPSLGMFAQGK